MILEQLSKKTKLRPEDIINILKIIKDSSPTLSQIVKNTNLPHTQVKNILNQLKFYTTYTSYPSSRIRLTKEGENILQSQGLKDKYEINKGDLQEFIKNCKSQMPKPKRNYDQFYADEGTILRRVKKFIEEKDMQDRSIVFLGDDDLTSLAVAYTRFAKDVAVLEIDKDILDVIERISKKEGLHVKTYEWDLRKTIPQKLLNKMDTVFTDPPYTPQGFDLFLRRSLEISKDSGIASHYICYGTSSLSRERSLKIQETINSYGLYIRQKYANFNKYISGAEAVGNTSDLYILEKTSQTRLGKSKPIKKIYTWE